MPRWVGMRPGMRVRVLAVSKASWRPTAIGRKSHVSRGCDRFGCLAVSQSALDRDGNGEQAKHSCTLHAARCTSCCSVYTTICSQKTLEAPTQATTMAWSTWHYYGTSPMKFPFCMGLVTGHAGGPPLALSICLRLHTCGRRIWAVHVDNLLSLLRGVSFVGQCLLNTSSREVARL